ncbi:pyrroline-5-carboxylate reductase [Rhodococcus wratislaviensis]|uniref:Pyrroline-5-carboxylate reductase n=1 Tax=Rhodococcus wratislaviensis NBRC 100605 TaxID=1219028 RepID=X0Q288_RHOWR|nr:pyrroline-5-carboxylate reductase [Rhodococcus wratislaviensis]GAF50299.1 pyrroline-5-carboxylate reductase [Rhodococcus wratislaviensis NBRC 100605]
MSWEHVRVRVTVIGVGRIGEALVAGLCRAGMSAESITVIGRSVERTSDVAHRHGVRVADLRNLPDECDVLVVAVKPQQIEEVLTDLGSAFRGSSLRPVVLSVVAGVATERIEQFLPSPVPVVRAMPNTPLTMGAAVTAIAGGAAATEHDLRLVESVLDSVGEVLRVPEDQLDAVTAVSGSGPAYVFLVAEMMIDAAMSLGLERVTAYRLVTGTLAGSSAMLGVGDVDPVALRAAVTSPAGTTAAALEVFERSDIRHTFQRALTAARDRSLKLSGMVRPPLAPAPGEQH